MLGPLKLPSGHQCGAPYDDAASWKQQRSGDRTLHVHKQRLLDEISKMKKRAQAELVRGVHTFLASVAVHVSLKRARTSEALVADFALVLLLRARRNLGAELAHH